MAGQRHRWTSTAELLPQMKQARQSRQRSPDPGFLVPASDHLVQRKRCVFSLRKQSICFQGFMFIKKTTTTKYEQLSHKIGIGFRLVFFVHRV